MTAADDSPVVLRCSTIVYRRESVLLVRRTGKGDWVLPGGRPRAHEGVLSCARREVHEETGLSVDPGRCAFVFETITPDGRQRVVEVVFLAPGRAWPDPRAGEPGAHPMFVPLDQIAGLDLRPPLGGHIRALHANPSPATAPYLGNLWRPARGRTAQE